jgi:hypothetical protein
LVYNGKVGGQLGVCSGGSIYCLTLATNAFTGPHFATTTSTMLAYAHGYGISFDAVTAKVYLSTLNDFTTWSLTQFFQRSQFADPWLAMFVDASSLIWLVGSETFEVWQDTGTGTQPWAPLSGLLGRVGIAAAFAFTVSPAGIFWLARSQDGGQSIVRVVGSGPAAVSINSVDTAVAGYRRTSTIADAEILSYHSDGNTFVSVNFPTAGATWTYEATHQQWAERGQWHSATSSYGVWAPRVHVDCFGKHLVGDRTTGTIWVMDSTYSTDIDGAGIRRLRRTPLPFDEHKRHPVDQMELLMDVGFGTTSGAGSDPQVTLRVSADGGNTFGNERTASIGRIGEYRKRVYWTRLGAPADGVVEVVWSDPSPVRVVDAYVNNAER